jgi:hypothetical protein
MSDTTKTRAQMLGEVADLIGNLARAGEPVPLDEWRETPEYTWIAHHQAGGYSIVVQPRPMLLVVTPDGEKGGVL